MRANNAPVLTAAILIHPSQLQKGNSCFHLLLISKTEKGSVYNKYPLTDELATKHFARFPKNLRELLTRFNDEDIDFQTNIFLKERRSGTDTNAFLERRLMRYFIELCEELLPYAPQLKFYQRTINPATGNSLTSSCTLSQERPALTFHVQKEEDDKFSLLPYYTIDQTTSANFHREKFLISSNNTYYVLRNADFVILEWLANAPLQQYEFDENGFTQNIVSRIEKTHQVNRNGLLSINTINTLPEPCIFVSEIGESMLMLTPRWKYDDILIDGNYKPEHNVTINGTAYTIVRNQEVEQQLIDTLCQQHPSFTNKLASFHYISFTEAKKKQWFFKTYQFFLANNIQVLGLDMLRHFRYSPHSPITHFAVKEERENRITVTLQLSFGKENIPLKELQKQLLSGQHNLLLKDNSIALLSEEWIAQYELLVKHGEIISKEEMNIPKWIFLSLEQGSTKQILSSVAKEEWLHNWRHWQSNEEQIFSIPAHFNATLRPYQQKGYEWMRLLSTIGAGGILADDMGLGKTLQTIAFIAQQASENTAARFLIACPASLIYNWQREFEKFTPWLATHIYNGANRKFSEFAESNTQIIISSYGTLRSDIELMSGIYWQAIILDESHAIKNISAQVTKAVYLLSAANKFCLSGTPVMNNTFDLYAQLQFLVPGLTGGQEFFRREYATPIDREGNKERLKALQQLTAPFILRRTKAQVATDLPEKTENILWCNMGEEQRRVYEIIKQQISSNILTGMSQEGLANSKLNILAGITKLRQVCASPVILKEQEYPISESIKLEILLNEIEQLKDSKALVFSQFKGMLHLVADECRKRNIKFYHFDGDTPIAERNKMVEAFQSENDDSKLFLISLKSGNAGLNLTAADYVFLIDPWWNEAVQQQAIDRTHRIGQTKSVFAYKMICKDTIEEKIIALQERKKAVSEELVNEDSAFLRNLTEEDVAFLFG